MALLTSDTLMYKHPFVKPLIFPESLVQITISESIDICLRLYSQLLFDMREYSFIKLEFYANLPL